VLSIAGGALLNTVLKGLVERPRPDIVPHQTAAALSSFPSGHAMMAAVTYLTLGALLALSSNRSRVKIYFLSWSILITVLVGVSRIYLGVHWPTDILAGWIVGAMWAVFCIFLGARILPGQGRSG
jgi:undecaprenyl-diphosphatase